MTTEKDIAAQAIEDARALLDTLLSSGWRELHVVSGETEIFIARPGGGANPMRAAPPQISPAEPTVAGSETAVTAPHVATLVDMLEAGTAVRAGQTVATLRVLDETQEVEAPVTGTIVRCGAQPGALVEYGMSLLSIAEAA